MLPMVHDINPLVHCLEIIAKKLGVFNKKTFSNLTDVTIDTAGHFQNQLQILLCPLPVIDLETVNNAAFPVLVQLDEINGWRVLIRNKLNRTVFYNPYHKCDEPLTNVVTKRIVKLWQCFPLNSSVQADYSSFFKFAVKFFKMEIIIILLLSLLTACASILLARLPSYLLEHAYQGNLSINIIVIAMLMLNYMIICYINEITINKLTLKILCCAIPTLWSRLVNLDIKYLHNMSSTELAQILFDYESSLLAILPLFLSLLLQLFSAVLLIIYMSYCALWLAFFSFFMCVFVFVIKSLVISRQYDLVAKKIALQGKTANLLSNIFLHVHKIRTANVEPQIYQKWSTACRKIKKYEGKSCKLELGSSTLELIMPVILFAIFYVSLGQRTEGSGYVLLTIMICIGQLSGILQKISSDAVNLLYLLPSLKRVQPLLRAKTEECNQKKWMTDFSGHIQFANIKLAHPASDRFILDDISFKVLPGQFVAFVGGSGAGKSSLFRVLLGFDQPNSGKVIIDGEDITSLALPSLRKHFGVVLQTTTLIPGTIFSNIAANSSLTLAEAWELADQLGLADEIRRMPMQMFTYISDNSGDSISGGQKQKILLARALANKPKILLLDEATSALDNKSQAIIYQYLQKLKITQLVIAHRISTIKNANVIYVLSRGKIIEKGTYQELLSKKSQYLFLNN